MEYITVKEAAQEWDIAERTVRKYCEQGRVEGAIHAGNIWVIPMDAICPNSVDKSTTLKPLANKVAYQKSKNNHYGIYEYLQVNLAYSSSRMASNRLTREQVWEIYRTGKVSVAFEPMKIDDVVEISNHFCAGCYMVDILAEPLTTIGLCKLTTSYSEAPKQTRKVRYISESIVPHRTSSVWMQLPFLLR